LSSVRSDSVSLDRRQFLARCGVLGAGLVVSGPLAAAARAASPPGQIVIDTNRIMQQLAFDTYSGLVAFIVPGDDAYSHAQGLASATPGGVAAKANELIMESADFFVPLPDNYAQAMAAAFVNGVSDQPLPAAALAALGLQLEQGATTLDQALRSLLANNGAVPLSLLFALFLNFEASAVNGAAMAGAYPASPFASSTFSDKAKVFQRLEQGDSDLVAMLDANAPEPLRNELSGLVKYVGGTLLEFAAYTPYVEYGVFDVESRRAVARPVGWEISNYLPGRTAPVNGRRELIGYYKGHRKSLGRAPRYRHA
jgi:hypothetical protein